MVHNVFPFIAWLCYIFFSDFYIFFYRFDIVQCVQIVLWVITKTKQMFEKCRLWEHSEPTTLKPPIGIISFITSVGVSTAYQISDKILYQLSDSQTMLPTLSCQSVTICIRQFHCDFSLSDCLNFFLLFLAPTHAFTSLSYQHHSNKFPHICGHFKGD